jgi:hypothetical protein
VHACLQVLGNLFMEEAWCRFNLTEGAQTSAQTSGGPRSFPAAGLLKGHGVLQNQLLLQVCRVHRVAIHGVVPASSRSNCMLHLQYMVQYTITCLRF